MPRSEALEPLRAEVVDAARQVALETRVLALIERLLDLCLVDVAALTAGGSAARGRRLRQAFADDLTSAITDADRCTDELVGVESGANAAADRSARARRLALAARLERRAARAMAKLQVLRGEDPPLADADV
ncbi:MAG: hypothetical protein CSA65_03260 [Proteobacteria bacterium]|nr:MAG: hypothetical protein CSB49_04395 [Pseudomonadota bacterium]PIE19072.1 MAG: hypothetical protein CSA65_03260 [Pseudomonadota bacterium]